MKINPCPFCGSEDVICYKDYFHMYMIQCDKCNAHGERHYTLEYAINYWNDGADEITDMDIEEGV